MLERGEPPSAVAKMIRDAAEANKPDRPGSRPKVATYKGCNKQQSGRWAAIGLKIVQQAENSRVDVQGFLGTFATEVEAALKHDQAVREVGKQATELGYVVSAPPTGTRSSN